MQAAYAVSRYLPKSKRVALGGVCPCITKCLVLPLGRHRLRLWHIPGPNNWHRTIHISSITIYHDGFISTRPHLMRHMLTKPTCGKYLRRETGYEPLSSGPAHNGNRALKQREKSKLQLLIHALLLKSAK